MKTKWYDLAKQLMRAQGMSQDSLADLMGDNERRLITLAEWSP